MKIIQAQNSGYLGFIKKENKNGVENSQKFVVNDRQKQTIVPLLFLSTYPELEEVLLLAL